MIRMFPCALDYIIFQIVCVCIWRCPWLTYYGPTSCLKKCTLHILEIVCIKKLFLQWSKWLLQRIRTNLTKMNLTYVIIEFVTWWKGSQNNVPHSIFRSEITNGKKMGEVSENKVIIYSFFIAMMTTKGKELFNRICINIDLSM